MAPTPSWASTARHIHRDKWNCRPATSGRRPTPATLDIVVGAVETINFGAVIIGDRDAHTNRDRAGQSRLSTATSRTSTHAPIDGQPGKPGRSFRPAPAARRPVETTHGASDGYYSLTLPGSDLIGCDTVTLEVRAIGYAPWSGDYTCGRVDHQILESTCF